MRGVLPTFIALSFLSCLNSLLVHLSKRDGEFPYKTVAVPLLAECLKLVISLGTFLCYDGTAKEAFHAIISPCSLVSRASLESFDCIV
jgi:hypothetical protein